MDASYPEIAVRLIAWLRVGRHVRMYLYTDKDAGTWEVYSARYEHIMGVTPEIGQFYWQLQTGGLGVMVAWENVFLIEDLETEQIFGYPAAFPGDYATASAPKFLPVNERQLEVLTGGGLCRARRRPLLRVLPGGRA